MAPQGSGSGLPVYTPHSSAATDSAGTLSSDALAGCPKLSFIAQDEDSPSMNIGYAGGHPEFIEP